MHYRPEYILGNFSRRSYRRRDEVAAGRHPLLQVRLERYAPLDEFSLRSGRRGVAPGVAAAAVAVGAVAVAVASSFAVGEVVVAGHCQAAADRRRRATPPPALRRCGDALVAPEAAAPAPRLCAAQCASTVGP